MPDSALDDREVTASKGSKPVGAQAVAHDPAVALHFGRRERQQGGVPENAHTVFGGVRRLGEGLDPGIQGVGDLEERHDGVALHGAQGVDQRTKMPAHRRKTPGGQVVQGFLQQADLGRAEAPDPCSVSGAGGCRSPPRRPMRATRTRCPDPSRVKSCGPGPALSGKPGGHRPATGWPGACPPASTTRGCRSS